VQYAKKSIDLAKTLTGSEGERELEDLFEAEKWAGGG
jgi:hypothetical protein